MIPTTAQLRSMFPNARSRLDAHLPYIAPAMERAKIDTLQRVAAFLAQLAHESSEYLFMEEIADGSAYEGRDDLGNVFPGDGPKFKGHGPIQITGRNNHKACGEALEIDLIANPRLICLPEYGTAAACWFWNNRELSLLADRDWFKEITRRINGGYTHLDRRVAYWERNRTLLGLPPVSIYDEEERIKSFQQARGLMADGAVGPNTMKALRA